VQDLEINPQYHQKQQNTKNQKLCIRLQEAENWGEREDRGDVEDVAVKRGLLRILNASLKYNFC
jgi:hypothetical protein